MRVLFLTPGVQDGGAERCFTTLCRGAQEQGWQLTVGIADRPAPALQKRFAALGIRPLEGLVSSSPWAVFSALRSRRKLLRLCRREKFDVVWFALPWATIAIIERMALAQKGLPIVSSFFALDPKLAQKSRRILDRWTWHVGAQSITVQCDVHRGLVAKAFRYPLPRIAVIPPANMGSTRAPMTKASSRAALNVAKDSFVIATLARLEPEKALHTIVSAAAESRTSLPRAVFLIGGDGSLRQKLQRQIDLLGVGERIRLLGFAESSMLLAAADAFALTSNYEGMPLSILEALRAKVPVVASRVGGIPEMLEEGRSGTLFTAGSSGELVRALEGLAFNPIAENELRRRAERVAQQYSPQEALAKTLAAISRGASRI